MLHRIGFYASVGAGVLLMGTIPPAVREHVHAEPSYQPTEIEAAKESIALSLLGQLQLSVGDLMWLKSMEYLHMGLVQRMPTKAEEARGFRRQDSQNTAAGLGHVEGLNMVLDKERDWRGIFGEIERHVKPYDTGHKHDDPVEIIPWYQLAVRLNPRLERLYTLGAFYLADFAKEPGEALEMLKAGIKANPLSFEIHGALGRLYVDFAERLPELEHSHHHHGEDGHHHDDGHGHHHHHHHHHDIESAEEAYTKAIQLLARAIELGKQHRNELLEQRQLFDEFQNQILGESYIYLSKAHIGIKNFASAVAVADEGWEEASKYSQRSLIRVQKRIAEKALAGIAADAAELAMLEQAGDTSQIVNINPDLPTRSVVDHGAIVLPVAVAIGETPPEPAALAEASVLEKSLLSELREHPYETVAEHAKRSGVTIDEAEQALKALVGRKFAKADTKEGIARYHLTPIGLYVVLGHYDFDFWKRMDLEVARLRESGTPMPNWP